MTKGPNNAEGIKILYMRSTYEAKIKMSERRNREIHS